ncbi:intradiol ring-cleavage dioxygenase [Hymenobacter qilianensis]|nr:intradiol ring-cleavage dioxygenase [Hymenobacter qilianensis]QNP52607.1 intradiol ring-cleavage dioxygenase [Hymenobacter qilianensis]
MLGTLLLSGVGLLTNGCSETKSETSAQAMGSTSGMADSADSCDSPDAAIACSFVNMPAALSSTLTMGGPNEPGDPLLITGTLLQADGKSPYAGVILYAYQTDHTGRYTKKGGERGVQKWHGHLHGWAKSDKQGRYVISSVRPASYPSRTDPAHIHAVIQEPGGRPPYYITDFVFEDDPLVTPKYIASIPSVAVGGTGVVELKRTAKGWTGRRDIILKK